MKVTLIHPCMGRRAGEPYLRSWQMEPLAPAVLAALTPPEVTVAFYDDRMEAIPFDEPTDLVGISVETYTAKRAYQIASEYRRRGVPVVMGGFHATLAPEEVSEYAEAVVVGEAEEVWPRLLADFRQGRLRRVYRADRRPSLSGIRPDRRIFAGKRYLPVGLVEAGRGCLFRCEFCAVQSYYGSTHARRPIPEIIDEVRSIKKPLIFFVDDNVTAFTEESKEFLRALIPLKIRWVSQGSVDAAHDEEYVRLLKESGCVALLIGFESLNPENLQQMHKDFNTRRGGFEPALANLRKYGIRLYPTFILGYDGDTEGTFRTTLAFAIRHRFFVAAFNHLLAFPGTPLYRRLKDEGRLRYDPWWLHPDYRFGMTPLAPKGLTAEAVAQECLEARLGFYSWRSILKRWLDFRVNSRGVLWSFYFLVINLLMRREVTQRQAFPLGDETYRGPLIKAVHAEPFDLTPLDLPPAGAGRGC